MSVHSDLPDRPYGGSGLPRMFGRYTLLAHLGRGSMADVYQARLLCPEGVCRKVAIKCLLPGMVQDRELVEMFINEARLAARLSSHPNVVYIHEFGHVDGEPFLVMEYIEGQNLRNLLKQNGRLEPFLAVRIMRDVALGIEHAHRYHDDEGHLRPILHRDVSPQNVMVGQDGQAKLVDFGIAKAIIGKEAEATLLLRGKVAYTAPELFETFTHTPQTDIFAAGVVLYEALTGRWPFAGRDRPEIVDRIRRGPLIAASTLVESSEADTAAWRALDTVLEKALERRQEKRYQSAGELAGDLDAILHRRQLPLRARQDGCAGEPQARPQPAERSATFPWPTIALTGSVLLLLSSLSFNTLDSTVAADRAPQKAAGAEGPVHPVIQQVSSPRDQVIPELPKPRANGKTRKRDGRQNRKLRAQTKEPLGDIPAGQLQFSLSH